MNTTTLERRSLPKIDPEEAMTQDVLDYAHEQLGYHHPQKEKLCKEGSLACALRIAGITPFSHDSVRKYKEEQIKKFGDDNRLIPLFKFFGVSIVLAVASSIIFVSNDAGLVKTISSVCASGFVAMFVVLFIILVCSMSTKDRAFWKITPLKEYSGPVPGFALATAKEIHQRVCGATFFIDEMIVEKVQRDPFLVVRGDGEEYYVEVWEEPGYEQKRKA
ncbi:MAG: hypothetical protein G01um101417_242 [Parcubacteria group bacterium Gr01-1014_17]|nr:MAG: hypothetical protein G01um101417_242 [Parcubacteria group bacterium Gr01-1014_17]